jgi:hypothetical protein
LWFIYIGAGRYEGEPVPGGDKWITAVALGLRRGQMRRRKNVSLPLAADVAGIRAIDAECLNTLGIITKSVRFIPHTRLPSQETALSPHPLRFISHVRSSCDQRSEL